MFDICLDLGIDDPITWMNHTSRVTVDWWIAHRLYKAQLEQEAYERAKKGGKSEAIPMSGEQASQVLSGMVTDGERRQCRGTILRSDS